MTTYNITAQKREITGKKVNRLRREGLVPATVYGPSTDPVNLQFVYRDLEVALLTAGGTNIIDIAVEDDQTYSVLARDVQRDVIRGDILHVDFFAVDMNVKIRADIPLVLQGESPLVASRKGIMITGPNTLTVEMLPSRLMNEIVVDLSVLDEMGAAIHVADLPLDEDIMVINDPEEMIAKIVQPSAARAEAQIAEAAEGDVMEEGEEAEAEEAAEAEE